MRKTNKSILLAELEKFGESMQQIPICQRGMRTTLIIDGMAQVQMVRTGNVATFGELAKKHFQLVTAPLGQNGCDRVDVVFDQYKDL
jgi:hypothetical protein